MAHQVVSGLLLGAVQVVHGDAQGAAAQRSVGAAGQTHSVQRPVQRAGREAELGAQRARGRQTGADTQNGILRGHRCHVWAEDEHTQRQTHGAYRGSERLCSGLVHISVLFELYWF